MPIASQFLATVARAVYNEWFARYGVPEQLYFDRGKQFKAALFAGVRDIRSQQDAHDPLQAASERQMQTIQSHARLHAAPRRTAKAIALEIAGRACAASLSLVSVRSYRLQALSPCVRARDALACQSRHAATRAATRYSNVCR